MSLFENLRKSAGAIFAVLMVVAILTPTADIFACGGEVENAPLSKQQIIAKAALSEQDGGELQHEDDGDGCLHGHCHHGFGIAKLSERDAFSVRMIALSLSPGIERPLGSAPPFELLRPPRA